MHIQSPTRDVDGSLEEYHLLCEQMVRNGILTRLNDDRWPGCFYARVLSETPKIFHVNWFQKDADARYPWPGYSENLRVVRWIVERVHGRVLEKESPIG